MEDDFAEDYMLLFLPMYGSMDKAKLNVFSAELDQLDCQVRN